MNQLPASFYVWFPVRNHQYRSIYFNIYYTSKVYLNHFFIELLKNDPSIQGAGQVIKYLEARAKIQDTKLPASYGKVEQSFSRLQQLHFTPLPQEVPFYSLLTRKGIREDQVWLPSERFFWSFPSSNMGSSRHMLIYDIQLKGSGRNPLATREDLHHAWGGQFLWQNLKALAVARIYRGALPMGILETYAFSLEEKELEEIKPLSGGHNSVLFREATGFRLTQVMTDFDSRHVPNKPQVQNIFLESLKRKGFSLPESYFFQYASMLMLGMNDLNITRENVMLEGSLIDYEDVHFLGSKNTQSCLINLKVVGKMDLQPGCKLEDLGDEVYFFTSNFSMYLDALKMTFETIKKLLEREVVSPSQCSEMLLKFLNIINENIYQMDESFIPLMEKLSGYQGSYLQGLHYFHHKGDHAGELIKLLKTYPHEVRKVNPETDNSVMVEVRVDFPRGQWRDSHLSAYYSSLPSESIDELTGVLLKKLQMEFLLDADFDQNDCLKFSSFADEMLSRYAWVYPYQYTSQGLIRKEHKLDEVLQDLRDKLNFEDAQLMALAGHVIKEDCSPLVELAVDELAHKLSQGVSFVLKGAILTLPQIKRHYVALAPKWISA